MDDRPAAAGSRLAGRTLARLLLVESCASTLLALFMFTYAVDASGVNVGADTGQGILFMVGALVLAWGGGLYHYALDRGGRLRGEFRRDERGVYRPEADHIEVTWTGNDILFGLTGAFMMFNLLGIMSIVGLSALFGIPANETGTARATLVSTVGELLGYFGLIASVLAFTVLRRGAALRELGWRRPVTNDWFYYVPLITAGVVVIANFLLLRLNTALAPSGGTSQCSSVRDDYGSYLAAALLITALVAPLIEETVFRGFLYGFLRNRIGPIGGALVSGFIFAAYHIDLSLVLPLWFLGTVLALVYERSRSLYPGMIIHGFYNVVGTVVILFGHAAC